MAEIIFTTRHGSHLYGMATPMSDHDSFVVTTATGSRAHQTVRGDIDVTTMGWSTFLAYATGGSHQALEALFSREKVWHSREYLAPMLDAYRVTGRFVLEKYERTITKFSHADDFKRRRHAVRLWLNLQDLRAHGRFDPRLTPEQVGWASDLATENVDRDELALLLREGRASFGSFLEAPFWWDEICIRASGEVICDGCGRPYWRHHQVAKIEAPSLVRACDGRLLKL